MSIKEIERHHCLGPEEKVFAQRTYKSGGFNARRYHEALKVARIITSLRGSKDIKKEYLAEALGYGGLEEKIWGQKIVWNRIQTGTLIPARGRPGFRNLKKDIFTGSPVFRVLGQ